MMKKNSNREKKGQSLKPLFFYGVIVSCVILIALFIRIFSIIEESKFDGQHQFTLAIGNDDKVFALMSFEPLSSSLSLLTFPNDRKLSFVSLNKAVGIIPGGYIRTGSDPDLNIAVSELLQTFFFKRDIIYGDITFYDLLQFWFYSNKIPAGEVYNQRISALSDTTTVDKAVLLMFADSALAEENVSVQIINAAGGSGLGSRLARVISNLGGNVVSVETASVAELYSKILYFDSETYTLRKLKSLLPYHHEKLGKKAIAEIIIIIGKDNKDTKLF